MFTITLALILAQPKAPAGPTLTTPVTLGARAGTTATIPLKGTKLESLNAVWLGRNAIPTSKIESKTDSTTVTFDIPKDTAVGVHALRVATKDGITNLRPFCVDDLADVPAVENRTKKETPQVLTGPGVIAANATADASDWYKLSVKAGERWAFEVVGRRLGSPIDPVIILYDAKSGRELPGLYADDTIGLQTDCRLSHTFKTDAEILIEVRDTTYRGGADYGYRLRVGDFPSAMCTFPLATNQGARIIGFAGPSQIPGVKRPLNLPPILSPSDEGFAVRGWGVPVVRSAVAELVEQEPNNDAKSAKPFHSVPGSVSAVFGEKNDRDCFRVKLKKGDKISIVAEASEFNAPTEVLLKVLTMEGKELAASDPAKLPTVIEFTSPSDGTFIIQAEHLNFAWGPTEVYRLVVKPLVPDATVMLGTDRITVPGKLPITAVNRIAGYDGPIELMWDGDAAVIGTATIPAKAAPTVAAPFQFELKPSVDAKPGVYAGRIMSKVKDRSTMPASTLESLKAAFPGLANPPPEMNGSVFVVVPAK